MNIKELFRFVKRFHINSSWSLSKVLISTEMKMDYLVDVGAHRGNFANEVFSELDLSEGILFEPNPSLFETSILKLIEGNSKISGFNIALGATKGKSKLHVAKNDGLSSSLLKMLDLHEKMAPDANYSFDHEINVDTLDNLVPNSWKDILLKIDVQGFELEVLKGANSTLLRTNVIVVEVSFDDLYQGAPSPADLISYLYERNFVIYQIHPVFTSPSNRWLQADLIMVRRVSVIE